MEKWLAYYAYNLQTKFMHDTKKYWTIFAHNSTIPSADDTLQSSYSGRHFVGFCYNILNIRCGRDQQAHHFADFTNNDA